MARRRRQVEEDNHERWLVSYADFITLLFAFFVVMYAISSVNEGKYRVLTETLSDAFQEQTLNERGTPIGIEKGGAILSLPEPPKVESEQLIEPPETAPVSETTKEPPPETQEEPKPEPPKVVESKGPEQAGEGLGSNQQLREIAEKLEEKLVDLTSQGLANIRVDTHWIELTLDSQLLFESAAARLNRDALRALRDVSQVLKGVPNEINVEGYTDNIPIRTLEFPSNWELSAARAASVVNFMTRLGVDPGRMAAVGFGEYRPIAENDTAEGRAQNRRVTLLILAANEGGAARGSIRTMSGGAVP